MFISVIKRLPDVNIQLEPDLYKKSMLRHDTLSFSLARPLTTRKFMYINPYTTIHNSYERYYEKNIIVLHSYLYVASYMPGGSEQIM